MKPRRRGATFGEAWYEVDWERYRRHLRRVARLVDQPRDLGLTVSREDDGRLVYGLVPRSDDG